MHHRPGHSPSDTIFHDEARGIVLGADHLIKHISSNPLISRPLTPAASRTADGGGGGGETAERPHALEIYIDVAARDAGDGATSTSSSPATASP